MLQRLTSVLVVLSILTLGCREKPQPSHKPQTPSKTTLEKRQEYRPTLSVIEVLPVQPANVWDHRVVVRLNLGEHEGKDKVGTLHLIDLPPSDARSHAQMLTTPQKRWGEVYRTYIKVSEQDFYTLWHDGVLTISRTNGHISDRVNVILKKVHHPADAARPVTAIMTYEGLAPYEKKVGKGLSALDHQYGLWSLFTGKVSERTEKTVRETAYVVLKVMDHSESPEPGSPFLVELASHGSEQDGMPLYELYVEHNGDRSVLERLRGKLEMAAVSQTPLWLLDSDGEPITFKRDEPKGAKSRKVWVFDICLAHLP